MSKANKNDKKDLKPAIEFLHPLLIWGVGLVMRAGELKYGGWNFTKGHGRLQLCAAAMRHILLMMKGEDIDQDCTDRIGEPVYHWDCVVANMNMLVYQRELGTLINDQPIEGVNYNLPEEVKEEEVKEEEVKETRERKVGDIVDYGSCRVGDVVKYFSGEMGFINDNWYTNLIQITQLSEYLDHHSILYRPTESGLPKYTQLFYPDIKVQLIKLEAPLEDSDDV